MAKKYKLSEKDRIPSSQMVKDLMSMSSHELNESISEQNAYCVGRKILDKAKERDDLYRVPTAELKRLVNECKKKE